MILTARELNVIIDVSMFIGFLFGAGSLAFLVLIIDKVKKNNHKHFKNNTKPLRKK